MNTPSDPRGRAHRLFGTDEPVATPRRLRAGDLSAVLAGGVLRDIRWGALEVLRGIAFVVRDTRWGTYAPALTGLAIREEAGGFAIDYQGSVGGDEGEFTFAVRIEGRSEGRLNAVATGRSVGGFRTNRTGFVVLHPLDGVVGRPLLVTHPDGTATRTAFPRLIGPDQPATDIARLAHSPAPGMQIEIGFSGDTFEMEDHRNWTDASFKTYVRPLSRGYPYRIETGETLAQAVELAVGGPAPEAASGAGDILCLRWGGPGENSMPDLGLYADRTVLADLERAVDAAVRCRPGYVQARVDLREAAGTQDLDRALRLARAARCPLQVDVVVPGLDPVSELGPLVAWAAGIDPVVDALFVIPARDLRSRPPEAVPAGEARTTAIVDAARALFPGLRIGGGMPVGFAELNRNRPPPGLDWVTHATQAIVHAADDTSVMETLQALPHVVATTRALVGTVPYRIGPATIGMPPSASASPPIEATGDRRIAIASRDPRQGGLFAAAFLLGYVVAAVDVQAITPAAPTGDFGLVDETGARRPMAAVFTGIAAQARRPRLAVTHDAPGRLAAVAIQTAAGAELWLANLTGEPIDVRLEGPDIHDLLLIDADRLSQGPADLICAKPFGAAGLTLDGYAVCRARARREPGS